MLLRKLILATFVIGLVFTMIGSAVADKPYSRDGERKAAPVMTNKTPIVPPGQAMPDASYKMPAMIYGHSDLIEPQFNPDIDGTDTTVCYWSTEFDFGSAFETYIIIGGANEGDAVSMRISDDDPDFGGRDGYLNQVSTYILGSPGWAGSGTGDIVVSLYEDDGGGLPTGAPFYTETILNADIIWNGFNRLYPSLGAGPDGRAIVPSVYHVAYSYVNGGPTDEVCLFADDGGAGCDYGGTPGTAIDQSGRSSFWDGSTWQTFASFNCGDIDFYLFTHQCWWWHECRWENPIPPGYVWLHDFPLAGVAADGSVADGIAQQYVSETADTLHTVRVLYHNYYGGYLTTTMANGFTVGIYPDDGTGSVNYGAGPIDQGSGPAEVLVPGGAYLINNPGGWCWTYVDFDPFNLIMTGKYHVVVRMTGLNPADGVLYFVTQADPLLNAGGSVNWNPAIAPNVPWELTATSPNWLTDWADKESAWGLRVYLCMDEFSECKSLATWWDGWTWAYGMDNANGAGGSSLGLAQMFVGNPVNRIEKIRFQIEVGAGDPGLEFNILAANGLDYTGTLVAPGDTLWTGTVAAVDVVYAPGWTEMVIPGGFQIADNSFYVSYNVVQDSPDDMIVGLTEETLYNATIDDFVWWGGAMYLHVAVMDWLSITDYWGSPENLMAEVDFCAIPVEERPCFTEVDAPMYAHDMYRTGASGISIGNIACDLDLAWHYYNPKGSNRNQPIIYDGMVVVSMYDEYVVIDLVTGAPVASLNQGTSGGALGSMGLSLRSTPMVVSAEVDDPANPGTSLGVQDIILTPTGSTQRLSAWLWGAPWTYLWQTDKSSGSGNVTNYGNMIVLGDVVYYSAVNGDIFANELYDGADFAGWSAVSGEINIGLNTIMCGGTDGTSLFYGTVDFDNEIDFGAIYKIDPADGTVLATFTDLQMSTYWPWIDPADVTEGFNGGIAYDSELDMLFVNSTCNGGAQDAAGDPPDGVFYSIDPSDMSLNTSAYSARSLYTTPILDQLRVYVLAFSQWVEAPLGGNMLAFRRVQGDMSYVTNTGNVPQDNFYAQGALSCETQATDIIIGFSSSSGDPNANSGGWLMFWAADNGDVIMRRKIDNRALVFSTGFGVALGADPLTDDPYVVAIDNFGSIYGLAKTGVDRPRLDISVFRPKLNISFGANPAYPLEIADAIVNTGCDVLVIDSVGIVADTDSLGASVPQPNSKFDGVRPDVINSAASIAAQMTGKSMERRTNLDTDLDLVDLFASAVKESDSRKAAVVTDMTWFVGPLTINGDDVTPTSGSGTSLAPGITGTIAFAANQLVLQRGPHEFFLEFYTNDYDYFLNNVDGKIAAGYNSGTFPLLPRMFVNVVGGCLTDTTTLSFGFAADDNEQLVTNNARIGTGDWTPHGFQFMGDGSSYYQGSYIYGVDKYRLAMNSQDWTGGGGENNGFFSAQGDPNWCDDDCKPAITASCPMGGMSHDFGITYPTVSGEMVAKTYIDSVFGYYDSGDAAGDLWTWHGGWETGRMDDTLSIGLMVRSRTYGAQEVAGLHTFTLEVMDVSERNGNPVPDWYFGSFHDFDIGGDNMAYDATISSGWAFGAGGTVAIGHTKIPFGPGIDNPLIGTVFMAGNDGLWASDPYYDSAYIWMSDPAFQGQAVHGSKSGDEQGHVTITSHDFVGGDSYRFGVSLFGLTGLTASGTAADIAPTAHMANKWAGFGRGDIDNSNSLNIADIVWLQRYVNDPVNNPGPIPFWHLGNVDVITTGDAADAIINQADVDRLKDYIINFNQAAFPEGQWQSWIDCSLDCTL